jgi:hypothetical protein
VNEGAGGRGGRGGKRKQTLVWQGGRQAVGRQALGAAHSLGFSSPGATAAFFFLPPLSPFLLFFFFFGGMLSFPSGEVLNSALMAARC